MKKRYGMVYLGSKEKILNLIGYMFAREYKKKFFIDLFAGGFSVSSFALQKTNFSVISNDLNHHVMALHEELIFNEGKKFDKIKTDWVSRRHFEEVRDHPENYPDWYVGYVINIWSFGCNQKDYLYAKELEPYKKAIHQAIVFDDFTLLRKDSDLKAFEIDKKIRKIDYNKFPGKRLEFMAKFKAFIKEENAGKTSFNKELSRMVHLERLIKIENLTHMEHLENLKRNSSLKTRLTLMNKDWYEAYQNVPEEILKNAFIYCDPPYEDAKQYAFGSDFDYNMFWRWFLSCPYPVYVSSYKAPPHIKSINFELKQQLLDNGKYGDDKPKKTVKENLYWNGKGDPELTFEDLLFPDEETEKKPNPLRFGGGKEDD